MHPVFQQSSIPTLASLESSISRLSTSAEKPLVVFDCDGTVISGDIGEAMFYRQIEHFLFRMPPALLWHDHPKRTELENLYDSLAALPAERRRTDRRFEAFADLLLSHYFGQLAEGRTAKACADIVRLFAGFTTDEVRRIAEATVRSELLAPRGEFVLGSRRVPRGIRYIRETVGYLERCLRLGVELLVISGSNRWSVEAVFKRLGVPPERILGIDLKSDRGVLTPDIAGAVPVLDGKLDALRAVTDRAPVLVFSDSTYDLPLFKSATDLCVLINSRNGSADAFFTAAGITRDERWAVIEQPTLEQPE